MARDNMLRVDDVYFDYGSHPVLSGISFSVEKGEVCGLFGPNGCGKTTLFKCCLRFLKILKGSVYMDGANVSSRTVKELAGTVSYVPQEHNTPFPYQVIEIVLMGRNPSMGGFFGVKKEDKKIAFGALERLGIADLAFCSYNQLSGGQRQMVLMARAIAQNTSLLFLDEPTSALDFQNQVKVWETVKELARDGKTILACSHDPNHVTWFCDRVVAMSSEGIIANGTPEEAITPEILDRMYGNACSIKSAGGIRMIVPRCIAEQKTAHFHG
ncbi:iron complex transport system ATP-binding protein [Methanomicrobium sp. W14]|uniref:ABC transporter ATP-binding protein n=1 Tax=Methanomicrobium sp. W14 TaxID=2817839 RepID=UPI001FD89E2E|nr:ABC transporter ATP-binding protein [Methanomicrobium sp. W14]MBP2133081.1 iron complex transport system ATP-binding protein [Methanomicrobium sp. W14]